MRDLLTKDFGWKLFSVALAVAIWLIVQTIRNEPVSAVNPLGATMTRTLNDLPVLVVSTAADVREFKVKPSVVQVTVSGRPEVVSALEEKEIRVTVDLTGIESEQSLRKRIDISTPMEVTALRVIPADVEIVAPPKRGKQ
jgi:YbbR domain-containing protein